MTSRMASGDLIIDRLIPEGFDDLQLEASERVQVEVKSRQGRLGPFPIGAAAKHVAEAWLRHVRRFGDSRRLVVILEQGLVGWNSATEDHMTEIPVARLIEEVDGLGSSLAAQIESQGLPSTVVDELKVGTTLLTCSWDQLTAETERQLGIVVDLPKAALAVVGRVLQSMVAAAADTNAEAGFKDRVGFDRTGLINDINGMAEIIDLEAIEYALAHGICSPVDRHPSVIGDAYYEGVSTQSGHVAADLVVPRPDLVEKVIAGLDMSRPVLLVGPSGVGKSAVLWTLPFALPGVLWFRVNRLSDDELPHVVRLLRANRASPGAPVGLLVDAAGTGALEGWSHLQQAVAAIPGVLLVGSARREDLFSLGALADCTILPVSLDEDAASVIHAGLLRRGATNVPHWREAFEQSHGLTLEYTHLLTQGTRLSDVLADQVADRVRGGRSVELRILALVATAGQWSASIPIRDLEDGIGAAPSDLRAALERLVEEHLLVEVDGVVGGIHQMRSRAIVDVIHRIPPPEMKETVTSVLNVLCGPVISRFLYEALREMPELEEPVLQTLNGLARNDVEHFMASLRGLEMLDFHRQASAWAEIAERHDVPPALRPLVLQFAIVGIEGLGFFSDQVRNAVVDMASLPAQSATRDALIGTVGLDGLASELAAATSADVCLRMLRAVRFTSIDWRPLLAALEPGSPLVGALQGWSLPAFGDCVSAAQDVSQDLARAFVAAAGGTDGILKRFRDSDPWIRELQVASNEGELVAVAKFLYLSQSEQGDPRERAVEIGKRLLRTLPDISKVDVKAVLPNGHSLEIDGFDFGSSGLLRQNDHHPGAIGWNQDRIRLAQSLFGTNNTERLAQAAGLIEELAKLVLDYGNAFVRSRVEADDPKALFTQCKALHAKGILLSPPLVTSPFSGENLGELNDSLSALVTEVCDKVLPRLLRIEQHKAVSAYITNTVLGTYLPEVRNQPWRLLGSQGAPPALDQLSSSLSDIVAVLTEMSASNDSVKKVINAARSGTAQSALSRAAERSRRWTRRRVRERHVTMTYALRKTGWKADVFWSEEDPSNAKLCNFAVTVALDSLADWQAALCDLVPILESGRVLGETPLLVPLLKGRSVVPCAMKLINKLLPGGGVGEFEHLLPPPLDQRLTTPVINAHSALQVCSGISILGPVGSFPDHVGQFLERTLNGYKDATTAILALEGDALVSAIVGLLGEIGKRVEDEFSGEIEAGTFAASMAEGELGDGSPDAAALGAILSLSLQWDSDPASAVALFESL